MIRSHIGSGRCDGALRSHDAEVDAAVGDQDHGGVAMALAGWVC